jgi:hypothetical protein
MLIFHEVGGLFPPMSGREFRDLKADIEANGLRDPLRPRDGEIDETGPECGRPGLAYAKIGGLAPETPECPGSV